MESNVKLKRLNRNKISILLFVFAFILSVTTVKANAEKTLKIGAIGALSGVASIWGESTKRGIQLAIDEVNARGGLKVGGEIYKLEQIIYDDKYTGAGGTTAVQRLIFEDKASFIIGPVSSASALAASLVANREKVLMLCNGYSPKIIGPEKPYIFRVTLTSAEFSPFIIKWFANQYPDKRRYVMIPVNDESGQTIHAMLKELYEAEGFKHIGSEFFERGTTDFVPLLTRLLTKDFDFVGGICGASAGEVGLVLKQIRQLGFKKIILKAGGGIGMEEIIRVAGNLADDYMEYENFDPTDPGVQDFIKSYNKKYGVGNIQSYTPLFYNACKLLFDTIKKEDTLDTEKLRIAIEKSDGYVTIFGPIRWSGEKLYGIRHQILTPFYINEAKKGKSAIIKKFVP